MVAGTGSIFLEHFGENTVHGQGWMRGVLGARPIINISSRRGKLIRKI